MKYTLEELYQFRQDPKVKEAVFNQYKEIEKVFKEINISIFQEIEECLDELTFAQLKEFLNKDKDLRNMVFDWEDLDIRVARSKEHTLVMEKIESLHDFYNKVNINRAEKISEIKKLFSKYLEDLRRKVMLLQLPTLPQVPRPDRVVEAASPQLCTVC